MTGRPLHRRSCALRLALILSLIPCACPAQDALGMDDDTAMVGTAGDPADLIIRGAVQVPADDIRAAIAGSVDLLPLRQENAQLSKWRDRIAFTLRSGYRHDGFRAATVRTSMESGHVAIDIVEGERTFYGAVDITAPAQVKAVIADVLAPSATSPAVAGTDADNPLQPDIVSYSTTPAAIWRSGTPVDDRSETLAGITRDLLTGVRREGFGGAGIVVDVVPTGPGKADLAITVKRAPARLRVGTTAIGGEIRTDQAEGLGDWLAIPPDAAADATLIADVRKRLRDCGRFVRYQVAWEDDAPPAANGDADDANALSATAARVAASGRCDLLITVKACPDAPMPWEKSAPWDAVIAARAATLAQLNAGRSDLVADVPVGSRRYHFTWSPRHGCVLEAGQGVPARETTLVVSKAGFRGDCGGVGDVPWSLPGVGLTLMLGLVNPDRDDQPFSLSANIGYSSKADFGIVSTLEPAAVCKAVLIASGPGDTVTPTWDGPVLVVHHASATGPAVVFRADPDRGLAVTWTAADGRGSITLVDHGWEHALNSAMGSGTLSATSATSAHPATLGDLLTFSECLGAQPLHQPLRAVIAPLPIGNYLQQLLTQGVGGDTLTLDGDNTQMSREVAAGALLIDQLAAARLPAHAWPRRLLNAIALASSGDMDTAATSMRPLFDDPDAGPLAFFACAAAARYAHIDPLTKIFADAGLAHCNADGLAADARALAGLSAPLLTGMGAVAIMLVAKETDQAKAAALRDFASACAQPDRSAARLEKLARQASDQGFAEWMTKALKDIEDPTVPIW